MDVLATHPDLEAILNRHDPTALAAMDTRLAKQGWGPYTFQMERELARYEDQRGWRQKSRQRLEKLLRLAGSDRMAQAILHLDLAEFAFRWNEPFIQHLEAAQRLRNGLTDWELEARQLRMNALYACRLGSYERARNIAEKSLVLYQQRNDWHGQATVWNTLGYILLQKQVYLEAIDFTRRVVERNPVGMDAALRADALMHYGAALLGAYPGSEKSALPFYQEALAIHRRRRDPLEIGRTAASLEAIFSAIGDYRQAYSVLREGLRAMSEAHILENGARLFENMAALRQAWGTSAPPLSEMDPYIQAWVEELTLKAQNPATPIHLLRQAAGTVTSIDAVLDFERRGKVLSQLGQAILKAELSTCGELARACAVLVQAGGSPLHALDPILQRFQTHLPVLQQFVTACRRAAERDPDWTKARERNNRMAVQTYGPGVMQTMPEIEQIAPALNQMAAALHIILGRSVQARIETRRRTELCSQVAALASAYPEFEILNGLISYVMDMLEIIVLRPSLRRGYRVLISGIADNFQLHLLLVNALTGDPAQGWLPGKKPDARLVEAYTNPSVEPGNLTATGVYNLVNWQGLRSDGTVSDNPDDWIWGESTPADIHTLYGQRIVLLAPPTYQRTWIVTLRYPTLAAEVQVLEVLDTATVQGWIQKILTARQEL